MAKRGESSRPTSSLKGDRVAHSILRLATRDIPRVDFLQRICSILRDHAGCEAVQLWLREDAECCHCLLGPAEAFSFALEPCSAFETPLRDPERVPVVPDDPRVEAELRARFDSVNHLPLLVGDDLIGWLSLASGADAKMSPQTLELLRRVARTLGIAVVNQGAHAALRERVKELTGLYELAQLAERADISQSQLLQSIADLLPAAWQYPEVALGRVVFDGREYQSPAPAAPPVARQQASIVIDRITRGFVELAYTSPKPTLDEGPFLKEERKLLDAIAREIGSIIERRQAAAERSRLHGQLLHADRLATIGQLAAGVAHELNEPLGAILGFAQLARSAEQIPESVDQDIHKIEAAALHAREIVRKLMLFARQTPPQTTEVDLNRTVEEGLYFLESRCARKGIRLRTELAPELPRIKADSSQLHQVLVNLVVNSVQAMPEGGDLLICSGASENGVVLKVVDSGVGMGKDVLAQAALPFFTTKDVDQGTGLGLAVVHGIVSSHGGTIHLASEEGRGTEVTIELPLEAPGEKERSNP